MSGKFKLSYLQEKKYSASVLLFSFPVSGINGIALKQLYKCSSVAGCDVSNGFDLAAVGVAVARMIESVLIDSEDSLTKFQVTDMDVGATSSHFLLSITTAPTGSSIRRVAREVIARYRPLKSKGDYRALCKSADIKRDDDGFDHAAAKFAAGLSNVHCLVISKTSLDGSKLKNIESKVQDKLDSSYEKVSSSAGKARKLESSGDKVYQSASTDGSLESALVYLYALKKKAPVMYADERIYWPHDAKLSKLAEEHSVELFVNKISTKSEKVLSGAKLAAAKSALITPDAIISAKKLSSGGVSSMIKKVFK